MLLFTQTSTCIYFPPQTFFLNFFETPSDLFDEPIFITVSVTFFSLFLKNLFTLNKSSMWEKFNTISVSYFYQSYNRSLFQVCDSRSLRTDAVIGEFKVRALTWVYDFYEYWTAVYCDKLGGGGTCALEIRRTQTSVSVFCFPQMDVGTIYNEHSEYMVVWFKHF